MSPELERLIGRAVIDKEFRAKLFDDPDGTVQAEGFKLDPGELDQVRDAVKERAANRDALHQQLDDAASGSVW